MAQLKLIDPQRRVGEEILNTIGVAEFGGDADVGQITRTPLETHLRGRCGHASPVTYNRRLVTISSLSWCEDSELAVPRSRRCLTALAIFDPQRAARPLAAFVRGS